MLTMLDREAKMGLSWKNVIIIRTDIISPRSNDNSNALTPPRVATIDISVWADPAIPAPNMNTNRLKKHPSWRVDGTQIASCN